MLHRIYTTEAFIFKEKSFGESDKIYSFFTKDFGRIDAVAQGVRYLKSKLRYSLSSLSFIRISFVATSSSYWRLVDAKEVLALENTRRNFEKTKRSFILFSLIDKLLQGQESDLDLWKKLKKIFLFLEKRNLNDDNLKNFEILSAIYILRHLGYVEEEQGVKNLSLNDIGSRSKYFVSLVKKSIEQSQL